MTGDVAVGDVFVGNTVNKAAVVESVVVLFVVVVVIVVVDVFVFVFDGAGSIAVSVVVVLLPKSSWLWWLVACS
jgi:hypothetical protein